MGATTWEYVAPIHFLWSLSSPQQPLETEDSPTVSSCPTIYIATRVPCKIHRFNSYELEKFLRFCVADQIFKLMSSEARSKYNVNFSELSVKFSQTRRPNRRLSLE